jgi:uncharacterized protein
MPNLYFPGVYVGESPGGARPIQGVDSTVAAFLGPAHSGSLLKPLRVTSLAEYEENFGDGKPLDFEKLPEFPNYLWHAARVFFEEGGKRLWIVRTNRQDGLRPGLDEINAGLKTLEEIPEVSTITAPGATAARGDAGEILRNLIEHAEKMRYRMAVLDSGDGMTADQLCELRGKLDSPNAALFAPRLRCKDPLRGGEILLPPGALVAGLFARNDLARGIHTSPTRDPLLSAFEAEQTYPQAALEELSLLGINLFRLILGGVRLWGVRTLSSDPESKYFPLRRYLNYLERSIDEGTQWAIFEQNNPTLWANLRNSIENFLFTEWKKGALVGSKPEEAYFVRCDRSTMTQNDLDNGRVVCMIGVALLRPAEFAIFRIGQQTAG